MSGKTSNRCIGCPNFNFSVICENCDKQATNDFLKKIGLENNDRCAFCEFELENLITSLVLVLHYQLKLLAKV